MPNSRPMNCILKLLLVLQTIVSLHITRARSESTTAKTEEALFEIANSICLEKTGYQPLENNAYFRVIETPVNGNVTLPCNYCGENSEDVPRIWFWKKREMGAEEMELEMGLAANLTENRIFTLPDNSLTIQTVSANDSGFYFCRSPVEDVFSQFHFSLDVVQTEVSVQGKNKRESDDERGFEEFNDKIITNINEKLSSDESLAKVFDKLVVRIVSEWDPWLPCDGCTGIRKRYAKCRVRSKFNIAKYANAENLSESQKLLLSSNILSCHSLYLARWFPSLYSITSSLPNYLKVQPCQDACVQDSHMLHQAKVKLDFQMDERSSMSFICPDADLRTKVVWRKDGAIIKPVGAPRKPIKKKFKIFRKKPEYELKHAFVDRMSVLQLCYVLDEETGVYTCYIDDKPVKAFNITVVTPEETLRERHYHFLLLTVYTSTLSGVIIALGATWVILRRQEFFPKVENSESRATLVNSHSGYVRMDLQEQTRELQTTHEE